MTALGSIRGYKPNSAPPTYVAKLANMAKLKVPAASSDVFPQRQGLVTAGLLTPEPRQQVAKLAHMAKLIGPASCSLCARIAEPAVTIETSANRPWMRKRLRFPGKV